MIFFFTHAHIIVFVFYLFDWSIRKADPGRLQLRPERRFDTVCFGRRLVAARSCRTSPGGGSLYLPAEGRRAPTTTRARSNRTGTPSRTGA